MLRNILLVALLGGVAAAGPLPHPPTFHSDGSVELDGRTYATRADYFHSAAFRDSGARCGSPEPVASFAPVTAAHDCAMNSTVINSDYNDNRTLVVQVVFHVIKKADGTGDIAPDLLKSQIDVLNEDYEALPNTLGSMGTNAKIKFVLARFDPMGNPTPGYEVVTNDSYYADPGSGLSAMKSALHWDSSRYFNVYTNDAHGFLGYATFPWDLAANSAEDGVVLADYAVGRNAPNGGEYNLGRTLTHESGHWLGLLHTFQGGCTGTDATAYTTGDDIKDTPRDSTSHFTCVAATTCTNQPVPIENYMEYTPDACMTKFTVEQANRIRCSVVNYRTINTEPKSMFTYNANMLAVTFTSAATDAESTASQLHYNWDFGDGMTSTDQNPMHTYATAGSYNVKLEVVDPMSAANTSTQAIVVSGTGMGSGSGSGSGTGSGMGSGSDGSGNNGGGDAGTTGGNETGGGMNGGGCCQAPKGGFSFLLCGIPVAFVLGRRRKVSRNR